MEPALATFTEQERQEAIRRFAVLQPHLNAGVPLSEAARAVRVSHCDPFSVGLPDTVVPDWSAW